MPSVENQTVLFFVVNRDNNFTVYFFVFSDMFFYKHSDFFIS